MSANFSVIKNKWVVITRPIHQAESIQKKLEEAGSHTLLFPLLEISDPKDPSQTKQQLAQLDIYDLIIFVSPNAAIKSLKWLDKTALLKSHTQIASIGKKTAIKLQEQGITPNIVPDQLFNSEAFLALPEIQQLGTEQSKFNKIAIIRGDDGRNLLHDTLVKRGAKVDYINTYQRRCPQTDARYLKQQWQRKELDIIMLTSGSSVANLFKLTKGEDWINHVTLLLGSQRMKQYIPSDFNGQLLIADEPSDETLFKTLIKHNDKQ